jgi:hypothetical protein
MRIMRHSNAFNIWISDTTRITCARYPCRLCSRHISCAPVPLRSPYGLPGFISPETRRAPHTSWRWPHNNKLQWCLGSAARGARRYFTFASHLLEQRALSIQVFAGLFVECLKARIVP